MMCNVCGVCVWYVCGVVCVCDVWCVWCVRCVYVCVCVWRGEVCESPLSVEEFQKERRWRR